MAGHSWALMDLCRCLRGLPPGDVDWMSVIGLANQTLTSPALIDLVDQSPPVIPEDVCAYIRNLHSRNVVRNDRLATQLEEAVLAMNDLGVTPILIKGAATLATAPRERRGVRLMADLDIVVTPEETESAVAALTAIGYGIQAEAPPESPRWHMELSRPSDVGAIDLQQRAPGPAYAYRRYCHPLKHCVLAVVGRGRAYIPTPTYQALMLIIHDQFQDYGYWLGDIDLRHLVELRDLDQSVQGIDWDELCSHVSGELTRNAVETQLLALAELLGVDIPRALRSRTIPRLQFVRRMTQARFPITRWPLLVITVCDLKNYRAETSTDPPQASRRGGGSWSLPKVGTLQFLLQKAAATRVGKV